MFACFGIESTILHCVLVFAASLRFGGIVRGRSGGDGVRSCIQKETA